MRLDADVWLSLEIESIKNFFNNILWMKIVKEQGNAAVVTVGFNLMAEKNTITLVSQGLEIEFELDKFLAALDDSLQRNGLRVTIK